MPLLDADIVQIPAQEQRPGWLGLVVSAGIAAVALAIGLAFLFAPKPTAQTVRRIVEAAEALVKKDPPKPAAEEDKPLTLTKHRPRRGVAPDVPATLAPKPAGQALVPVPVHPVTSEGSLLKNAELPAGTARARVRELLGEPDLALYELEKDHVVEHFVYVNRVQNYASSVLLMDGRVISVHTGVPSVRAVASGMSK